MSDLLPCPFCDGHADSDPVLHGSGLAATYQVVCRVCRSTGPPVGTRARAREEWNARRTQHITVANTVYRLTGDPEIASRRASATGEQVLLYVSATIGEKHG